MGDISRSLVSGNLGISSELVCRVGQWREPTVGDSFMIADVLATRTAYTHGTTDYLPERWSRHRYPGALGINDTTVH